MTTAVPNTKRPEASEVPVPQTRRHPSAWGHHTSTPDELLRMVKHEGISSGEYGVMRFLLHAWNRYDNDFELCDICGWDDKHLAALADWITGKATGQPVHYF